MMMLDSPSVVRGPMIATTDAGEQLREVFLDSTEAPRLLRALTSRYASAAGSSSAVCT
jgi:hypothetical protein